MSDDGSPQPPPPPFNPYSQRDNPFLQPLVPIPPPRPPQEGRDDNRWSFIVLVAAFVVLAGAVAFMVFRPDGSDGPGDAVEAWAMAAYEGDAKALCDGIVDSNIEQIEDEGVDCEQLFADAYAEAKQAQEEAAADGRAGDGGSGELLPLAQPGAGKKPDIEIVDVQIQGDRATVKVRVDDDESNVDEPLVVRKEDGRWKIDFRATVDPERSPGSLSQRCDTERRTVRTAVEAYRAQTGEDPTSAQDLVDSRMLREVPEHAVVSSGGTVRMTGDCA